MWTSIKNKITKIKLILGGNMDTVYKNYLLHWLLKLNKDATREDLEHFRQMVKKTQFSYMKNPRLNGLDGDLLFAVIPPDNRVNVFLVREGEIISVRSMDFY